jgi:hypothetical protein
LNVEEREEIDNMIERGRVFVAQHTHSTFGDDNEQPFQEFKEIMQTAKDGRTVEQLRL